MSELELFHEIPKTAEFHSAVMTTFSFDFHHFESQVLRVLKQKGITNVSVFGDINMLDQSIGNGTGHLKALSKAYTVNGIPCKGAFHPKITILAGEYDVVMLQGSGNITNGGHGKNHELFNVFYANDEDQSQLKVIQEAWHYLRNLVKSVEGLSNEKLDWVTDNCELLVDEVTTKHQFNPIDESFEVALLYNEDTSIWQQITKLIPKDDVKNIKVFSPFYDESGALINRLSQHFNTTVDAFLQDEKGIHPYKLDNDKIKFLAWDSTDRASDTISRYDRNLHSKIFWFNAGAKQYAIMGSANASLAAFGNQENRGANDEFAVLLKLKDKQIFEDLGLTGNYQTIKPKVNTDIKKIEDEFELDREVSISKVKIIGVDQNDKQLTLYINNAKNYNKALCQIFTAWSELIEEQSIDVAKGKIDFEIKSSNRVREVAYVQLYNTNSEVISNKQVVNDLHSLWNTNPSVDNRRLMKLCSIIETGTNNIFDVVEYFNTIQSGRSTHEIITKKSGGGASQETKIDDLPTAGLTYEEAIALDKKESEFGLKLNKQHSSIRVWDAIDRYFRDLASAEEDEDMDDEEGGNATTSRKRPEKKTEPTFIFLNSEHVLIKRRNKIVKFLDNYEDALFKAINHAEAKVGLIDFAMFLITMKQLLTFANLKVKFTKQKNGEEVEKETVVLPLKGSLMELSNFSGAILHLLGNFTTLLFAKELEVYNDEYSITKFEHYKMLVRRTALFSLAIMRESYQYDQQACGWFNLLAINLIAKLGMPNEDLVKPFEEFTKNTSLDHLDRATMLERIKEWANMVENKTWKTDCVDIEELGICRVVKRIPNEEEPKFLKLSRPGFDYNEDKSEYILPELYDCATGKLRNSLQTFKKERSEMY